MAGLGRLSSILGASVMLALAAPAAARDVYECAFPDTAANLGYLPPLIYVAPIPGKQVAEVVDGFIQHQKGGPIEGEIVTDTDSKLSVAWTFTHKSTYNEQIKVRYRLTVQKQGLSASLVGLPLNYAGSFNAQGKCKRQKG